MKPRFDEQALAIKQRVLDSPIVCSDETSARVEGRNWWEWVFLGTDAVLHVIEPSRGKKVPKEIFGDRLRIPVHPVGDSGVSGHPEVTPLSVFS